MSKTTDEVIKRMNEEKEKDFRKEVLGNKEKYPTLFDIEEKKNQWEFGKEVEK